MAIARLVLDTRALKELRDKCREAGLERAAREIDRAVGRSGRGFQLTPREVRGARELELSPRIRSALAKAYEEIREVERIEERKIDHRRSTHPQRKDAA